MRGPFVHLIAALGVGLTLGVAASDASACGEDYAPAIDYRIEGVSRAEKQLREGHYVAAAGSVIRMFPDIKAAAAGKDRLIDRAFRTLALASTRSGGSLPIDKEVPSWLSARWSGKSAEDRKANLEWSVATLRHLGEKRANDPGMETDLGEALAKLDDHRDEALKLLGGLAEKDLLASPEGYAALGKLRKDTGDAAGSDAAVKKCELMTKTASVCQTGAATTTQS